MILYMEKIAKGMFIMDEGVILSEEDRTARSFLTARKYGEQHSFFLLADAKQDNSMIRYIRLAVREMRLFEGLIQDVKYGETIEDRKGNKCIEKNKLSKFFEQEPPYEIRCFKCGEKISSSDTVFELTDNYTMHKVFLQVGCVQELLSTLEASRLLEREL